MKKLDIWIILLIIYGIYVMSRMNFANLQVIDYATIFSNLVLVVVFILSKLKLW